MINWKILSITDYVTILSSLFQIEEKIARIDGVLWTLWNINHLVLINDDEFA